MKKTTLYLLMLMASFSWLGLSAQNELLPPTQTTYLDAHGVGSGRSATLESAINNNYYVLISSNGGHSQQVAGPIGYVESIKGTYLKVFSTNNNLGTTLTPGSQNRGIKIDDDNIGTRVVIDNNNNIYVLCLKNGNDRLEKYNINGVLVNSTLLPIHNSTTNIGQLNHDICVAPNGDVLLASIVHQFEQPAVVKVFSYNSSLSLVNSQVIHTLNTWNLNSVLIDINGNRFVVGINDFVTQGTTHAKFYTYEYNPGSNNIFLPIDYYQDFSNNIYNPGTGNSEALALRSNGDIFYCARGNYDGIKRITSSGNFSSYSQGANLVDVDINDRVITCGSGLQVQGANFYQPDYHGASIKLFDANDNLEFTVDAGHKIKNSIHSICIYDCKFVITGQDDIQNYTQGLTSGGSPNYWDFSYEAFHQMFDCIVCDIPEIDLPNNFYFCNENFQPICVPNNGSNYLYVWEDVVGNVLQSSNSPCFTPTDYGTFTVTVSDKFGCSQTHTFFVGQGKTPQLSLNDVEFCKDLGNMPSFIGFSSSFVNAHSYSWTYNGVPISSPAATGYQLDFPFTYQTPSGQFQTLYEGTYCLTVTWQDVNDPSLAGCSSRACFEVVECCETDASFEIHGKPGYEIMYPNGTLTVQNNPNNTSNYTMEEFTVYVWCPGIHNGWTYLTGISRNANFNDPYVFTGLSSKCRYKVTHTVWSPCGKDTDIQYTGYGSGPLPIIVYPNPPKKGMPVNIEMTSYAEPANVEITNLVTGEIIFTGKLEFSRPLMVENSIFTRSKGGSFGMFNVKVYNSTSLVNKKIIVR